MPVTMKLLEVIVTSVDEARAAEEGGADRLELLRDLDVEGLTPVLALVEDVLASVTIPGSHDGSRKPELFHPGRLRASSTAASRRGVLEIAGRRLGAWIYSEWRH